MPFHSQSAAAWAPGMVGYVLDPENHTCQYKCVVLEVDQASGHLNILVYPDPNTPPNPQAVSPGYLINDIPSGSLTRIPNPSVPIIGYQQVLQAQGMPDKWEPMQQPQQSQQPQQPQQLTMQMPDEPVSTAVMPTQGAPAPQQPQAPQQETFDAAAQGTQPVEAATPPPPAVRDIDIPIKKGVMFEVGEQVMVDESQAMHSYWSQYLGKVGIVTAAEQLEEGEWKGEQALTLEIDGLAFPNVLAGRFRRAAPAPTPGPGPGATLVSHPYQEWLGKDVDIALTYIDSHYRGTVAKVDEEGIHLEHIEKPVAFEHIKEILPLDKVPRPGDQEDAQRVAKEQEREEATVWSELDWIHTLLTTGKVAEKETMGKRDYRKLMEHWALFRDKLQEGIPQAEAGSTSSGDAEKARQNGFEAACIEIQEHLNSMMTP